MFHELGKKWGGGGGRVGRGTVGWVGGGDGERWREDGEGGSWGKGGKGGGLWKGGRGAVGVRNVDIRLPGKGNSNFHGARPVHQSMRGETLLYLSIDL